MLDGGQDLADDKEVEAPCPCEREAGPQIPAKDRAETAPDLEPHLLHQIPDFPTVYRLRLVDFAGALFAAARAGRAVFPAAAEVPVGEGAEPFFSSASIRP